MQVSAFLFSIKTMQNFEKQWNGFFGKQIMFVQDEGLAREVINRIQKLRKKAGLVPTDKVTVHLGSDGTMDKVLGEYTEFITNAVRAAVLPYKKGEVNFLIQEDFQVRQISRISTVE
jgi:hypothetical protein